MEVSKYMKRFHAILVSFIFTSSLWWHEKVKGRSLKTAVFLNSDCPLNFVAQINSCFILLYILILSRVPSTFCCAVLLFIDMLFSKWKKNETYWAKVLLYFDWVSTPQSNSPCCGGHDKERHLHNFLGSELVLILRIQFIYFIFSIGQRCAFCWWGLGIIISLYHKARGWIQSIFCWFACQHH